MQSYWLSRDGSGMLITEEMERCAPVRALVLDSTYRVGLQLDIVEKETISQVRLAIGGGEADPRA